MGRSSQTSTLCWSSTEAQTYENSRLRWSLQDYVGTDLKEPKYDLIIVVLLFPDCSAADSLTRKLCNKNDKILPGAHLAWLMYLNCEHTCVQYAISAIDWLFVDPSSVTCQHSTNRASHLAWGFFYLNSKSSFETSIKCKIQQLPSSWQMSPDCGKNQFSTKAGNKSVAVTVIVCVHCHPCSAPTNPFRKKLDLLFFFEISQCWYLNGTN